MALVAQGLSNAEIGQRLFVTDKTVKFHLTNIYAKLKVQNRAQLIVKMSRHKVDNSAYFNLMRELLNGKGE